MKNIDELTDLEINCVIAELLDLDIVNTNVPSTVISIEGTVKIDNYVINYSKDNKCYKELYFVDELGLKISSKVEVLCETKKEKL